MEGTDVVLRREPLLRALKIILRLLKTAAKVVERLIYYFEKPCKGEDRRIIIEGSVFDPLEDIPEFPELPGLNDVFE